MTATAVQTSVLDYAPPERARMETGHLLQLDGLRAVAIALVMAEHLFPLHRLIVRIFPSMQGLRPGQIVPPLGFIGVSLFFVLSGFLITRILLSCRDRWREGESTLGREVGVFYLRRTLRIFPLYYGVLLVLVVLNVRQIHDRLPYHLTYTFNWLFTIPEHYSRGGFERHFWSLCVEEQFYLVWPWLILLAPRRLLLPGLLAVFALGPGWRGFFTLTLTSAGDPWPWQWTLFPTPACLDLLAMGAIVALAWNTPARRALLWICLVLGLPMAGFAVGMYQSDLLITQRQIFQQTGLALAFAAVVGFAAQGIPLIGRALEFAPVAYLGKISYGMYVFHNFTPPMLRWALGIDERAGFGTYPWVFAWGCAALTVALAAGSWHLYEGPINRLKDKVKYGKQ